MTFLDLQTDVEKKSLEHMTDCETHTQVLHSVWQNLVFCLFCKLSLQKKHISSAELCHILSSSHLFSISHQQQNFPLLLNSLPYFIYFYYILNDPKLSSGVLLHHGGNMANSGRTSDAGRLTAGASYMWQNTYSDFQNVFWIWWLKKQDSSMMISWCNLNNERVLLQ